VARKLLELLGALVASKLVIALALAVAASALAGAGSVDGGAATAITPPGTEAAAAAESGAVSGEAIGVLLAGAAALGVAAFSPLLVVGLFGLTTGAAAAQGVRQMPLRAAQRGAHAVGSVARLAAGPTTAAAAGAGRHRHRPAAEAAPQSATATRVARAPAPPSTGPVAGGNGSTPGRHWARPDRQPESRAGTGRAGTATPGRNGLAGTDPAAPNRRPGD
jgi:hypothetical protein